MCNTTVDFKAYWVCDNYWREKRYEDWEFTPYLIHKIKEKIRVPIRGLQVWVAIELYDNSFRIIILRRAGSDCCCLVHHDRSIHKVHALEHSHHTLFVWDFELRLAVDFFLVGAVAIPNTIT